MRSVHEEIRIEKGRAILRLEEKVYVQQEWRNILVTEKGAQLGVSVRCSPLIDYIRRDPHFHVSQNMYSSFMLRVYEKNLKSSEQCYSYYLLVCCQGAVYMETKYLNRNQTFQKNYPRLIFSPLNITLLIVYLAKVNLQTNDKMLFHPHISVLSSCVHDFGNICSS